MPNQSIVAPALALEVERRQRALGADALEHAPGHVGVLGEDAGRVPARGHTEPREVAGGDEREPLVVRLEDLAALVEEVAPGGVVLGDARVQHEVVAPAGNRERIELERAQAAEDPEHGVLSSLERTRRRERVTRHEEAACGLGGDPHAEDASGWQGADPPVDVERSEAYSRAVVRRRGNACARRNGGC